MNDNPYRAEEGESVERPKPTKSKSAMIQLAGFSALGLGTIAFLADALLANDDGMSSTPGVRRLGILILGVGLALLALAVTVRRR